MRRARLGCGPWAHDSVSPPIELAGKETRQDAEKGTEQDRAEKGAAKEEENEVERMRDVITKLRQ